MSTSLMSCVRENTPPLNFEEMQAEVTTMSLPSEYSEPQKRRRFNALKNLRRIFRRRTVASAETLPSKGKIRSHIAPVQLGDDDDDDGHFRDSFKAYKQPSVVSVRCTGHSQEHDDYQCNNSRIRSTTLDYGQGGSSSSSRGHRTGSRSARHVEDYSFDDSRRRDRYCHKLLSPVSPAERIISINVGGGGGGGEASCSVVSTGDWTNGAHKRSHSEDRLKEGVPLDQELSKSHESVFREPGDMAMLTIGLKTELIDVLRKRRSRPDSFEANLETTTLSPKRSSAEMYDLRNTLPNRKVLDPDSQVRLIGTDAPDLAPLPHSGSYYQKMHFASSSSASKDPDHEPAPALLSHSAARHKMAVRPKKKGPTRFRRSVESADTSNGLDEVSATSSSSSSSSSDNNHLNNTSLEEKTSTGLTKESVVMRSSNGRKASLDIGTAAAPPTPPHRLPAERPKSMLPLSTTVNHYSSHSPPKSSFSYFESLKTANRHSHSALPNSITKSEEHLQESARGTSSNDMSYAKSNSAAAPSPCVSRISGGGGGRRRSVEKSQSFKIFSNSPTANQGHLESAADRRELFHMNRPVSYKEFSKPQVAPRTDLRSVLDNNSPVKQQQPPPPQKNISAEREVLPIVKTNNIIQIEENIDKLVSSPFVPPALVKKVATFHEELKPAAKSTNNVSITTIRSSVTELSAERVPPSSALEETTSPMKASSPGANLRRRSSSRMEKSPSVGSLNTLGSEESNVPEFMRIHLNRVENSRPKSSIVLYKGTSDTLPRRFSRELDATKPPLPPALNLSTLKRPSINKSQETITESNHVIIVPVLTSSPVRKTSGDGGKADNNSSHIKDGNSSQLAPSQESKNHSAKPETVVLREDFSDRKGSVSEEKAKIERRLSIADERSVIRKKSIPTSTSAANKTSNKDDNTPELMKVFARRSMKLKDDDEEPEAAVTVSAPVAVQKSDSRSSMITDSDKENQSSSREELSPKAKATDEDSPSAVISREQKARNGDNVSSRARTFMEVKNMLQSPNGNAGVTNINNISGGLRSQKGASAVVVTGGGDMARKESSRDRTVSETRSISDADILPEFKRIVERREEWESRAKMWK